MISEDFKTEVINKFKKYLKSSKSMQISLINNDLIKFYAEASVISELYIFINKHNDKMSEIINILKNYVKNEIIINLYIKHCINILLDAMKKINQPIANIRIFKWDEQNQVNITLNSTDNCGYVENEICSLRITDEAMYYILDYFGNEIIPIDTFENGNYIMCDSIEAFDNYLKDKGVIK